MPKRSAASLSVFGNPVEAPQPRLKPPDDLGALERQQFIDIVSSKPASHFEPSDLPLLVAYVSCLVGEREAAGEWPRPGDRRPALALAENPAGASADRDHVGDEVEAQPIRPRHKQSNAPAVAVRDREWLRTHVAWGPL